MFTEADKIMVALRDVIATGDRTTRDLGGVHGTTDFTDAVLSRLS
jgi:isocitrate dehydrogenase (NAD+)